MAKRSRSEILQGQARLSERIGAQQVNGYFPFRLSATKQESDDFHHSLKTGLSATQNLKNAEKLRAKAWSIESDKNPKLKGSLPFEKRTLKVRDSSMPLAPTQFND